MPEAYSPDRRTLLRDLLVMVGASATSGLSVKALAAVASGSERFFDDARFATLTAIADTLIPQTETPGAIAVDVPLRLDALMLNWAAAKTRDEIVDALTRLDAEASTATGKHAHELSAAERHDFLVAFDTAALQPAERPADAPKPKIFAGTQYVVDNPYQRLKNLVVTLYYVSEPALTQELIYQHVPGKWEPSLEVKPDMHAFASVGPF